MYFEILVIKLRLIHSAGLTIVNKEVVPYLFVCFCHVIGQGDSLNISQSISCMVPRETKCILFYNF